MAVELGAVSEEEAAEALSSLRKLEKNRPTPEQLMRYAATGAVVAPAIGAMKSVVTGGKPPYFSPEDANKFRKVLERAQ